VKPENVLLRLGKPIEALLADFDLMIRMDEAVPYTFGVVGTPAYHAPEVMADNYYNEKVDVWCLGVTLLFMLTGGDVFKPRPGQPATYRPVAQRLRKPTAVQEILWVNDVKVSNHCLVVLNQMLEEKPDDRPKARDLMRELWFKSMAGEEVKRNIKEFGIPEIE
jgi:serine/threonine protein kinase